MKPKLVPILAVSVALALTPVTDASWGKGGGGRGGGGHGGGHGGGFGGGHFGGHGGGHYAGGHFGGHHGHYAGGRFGGHHGHYAGGHFGGGRGGNRFAGASQFRGRGGANRNAFGNHAAWNHWAGGGGSWGGWGGGWGGWVGPVFWPFFWETFSPTCCGRMPTITRSGPTALSRATTTAAMRPRTTIAMDMATAMAACPISTATAEADTAATPARGATMQPERVCSCDLSRGSPFNTTCRGPTIQESIHGLRPPDGGIRQPANSGPRFGRPTGWTL
jgi:hypothetical protein